MRIVMFLLSITQMLVFVLSTIARLHGLDLVRCRRMVQQCYSCDCYAVKMGRVRR
jgi:hypothetical protein